MKKQSTLFPNPEKPFIKELDFRQAEKIATEIERIVAPHCVKIEIAGSLRRQRENVHDIDYVVVARSDAEWQKISDDLKHMKAKPNCQGNSIIKALFPCKDGLFKVDFYRAKPATFGILLLIRTGSAEHNMWLAAYSISKGMRLKYSEGLIKEGKAIAGQDEKEVFAALGLDCPPPHKREIVDHKPLWMVPDKT